MNGFERIDSALKGREPDRIPVMLHNFMMAACAIPPDTPPENLKMMIETARNFR